MTTLGHYTYSDYGTAPDPPHQPMYLARILRTLKSDHGIRTILDAGCGDGNFAASLADHGYQMYGIDLSESGIRIASKRACGTFALGSMYDDLRMPFQDVASFDAVIAIDTVEHLYSPRIFARRSFESAATWRNPDCHRSLLGLPEEHSPGSDKSPGPCSNCNVGWGPHQALVAKDINANDAGTII